MTRPYFHQRQNEAFGTVQRSIQFIIRECDRLRTRASPFHFNFARPVKTLCREINTVGERWLP
jgi:hypothetical protein